jgi:predicted outer membrane protein
MRWSTFSLKAAFAILLLAPIAEGTKAAELHLEDIVFLLYATELDRTQIQLGQLALEKAEDEQVRRFAGRMVDYHRQSSDRLTQIARQYGIEPPQGLSPLAERMQDGLEQLTGARFDHEYMAAQVIYDYSAHYFYRREARHGQAEQVWAEAARQAPQVREHRREAQQIAQRLEDRSPSLHAEDRTFLLYAMDVDLTQVQLSGLAAEKAEDEQVRRFARRMVDYHGRSYDRLAGMARENGIEPLQEMGLIAHAMQDALEGLRGPMFDWQYINAQVIYHYAAFYRYERENIHGRGSELRGLAGQAFRDVQEHHDDALGIVREWSWDEP